MLTDRRTAILGGALAVAAAGLPRKALALTAPSPARQFPSKRPAPGDRKFASPAVEGEIARVTRMIADPELAWMFGNCYPNTLDTTVRQSTVGGKPDSFVITGDIPCMWLRDSSAQVQPYLHLAKDDPRLRDLFRGLIGRHARSVLIDPYANAFMEDSGAPTSLSWAKADETRMKSGVAERKWEIDSLCYVLRNACGYWRATHDPAPFDSEWNEAARAIVRTFREQQRKDGKSPYTFQRASRQPTETQLAGVGLPTRKVGLIHSAFRPSDDACLYPLFVPANLFAVTVLRELAAVVMETRHDAALAREATALATEVERALAAHGTMTLPDGRNVWAYEVDGFGNAVFMDDANIPSLSGLAWLGCVPATDPRWRRTAAAAWSPANPWFFRGKAGEGIGGPHEGIGQIWPMSLTVRALSATDDATILRCLATLKRTHADTGFMHETFDQDDPSKFTRSWFAWANGLFGELILHVARTRPRLLQAPLDRLGV
ncbi:MAG: glycoside hydrolase family 125 protein [Sphingomonas sp.]|uniref:glycoside hydrolase family 125 protein n=1 Tax=Sphingomonas sp. TaxID=28214 RepID=UPI003F7EC056